MRSWVFIFLVSIHLATAADLPLSVTISGELGPYTKERWKADWPGCEFEGGIKEGRVMVTEGQRLRVNFALGKIGPEAGGAGWRMPFGKHETAEMSYTLRFSKGFDFRFRSDTSSTTVTIDPLGTRHSDSGTLSSKAGSISLSAKYNQNDRTIVITAKRGGVSIGEYSWRVEAVLR